MSPERRRSARRRAVINLQRPRQLRWPRWTSISQTRGTWWARSARRRWQLTSPRPERRRAATCNRQAIRTRATGRRRRVNGNQSSGTDRTSASVNDHLTTWGSALASSPTIRGFDEIKSMCVGFRSLGKVKVNVDLYSALPWTHL